MTEGEFQIIRGGGFVAALLLATAAQRLSSHAHQKGSWRVNGAFWMLDALVVGMVCGACACTAARWAEARQIGLLHAVGVPPWLALILTVVALDFVSYVWHRANHVVPILWRLHQVHHSDPAFTVSTALRFHPGELLLSLPLRLAAVVAVGASPAAVVAFEVLFAVANFMEHGDISLPLPVERGWGWVCITPAFHRLHHARDWAKLNTNFGTVFVFWDRLLGSYRASSSEIRVETGLPGVNVALSLRQALVLPFDSALLGQGRN